MTIRDLDTALRRSWQLALAVLVVILGFGLAAAFVPAER
jgi:hypothetical protein